MSIPYLDFELEIGPGDGREYPLAVLRSPAGETRAQLRWPFGQLELENRLLTLQNALLRSGGPPRRALSQEEQAVQHFGAALFDLLIAGEVRSRYDVSRERAGRQGAGLRLKLRIAAPELAALPWEFLFDPRGAEYICLSQYTPIVRYIELPRPVSPLATPPPLRILGLVANPSDLPPLDVVVEKERVARSVAPLQGQGLVELAWLDGQTWRDLQRAMRRGPWHVLHFVGHSAYDALHGEGLVVLEDAQGKAAPLHASQLARLLADHRPLRLALFNSCEGARAGRQDVFSSTAATLVRAGLPAVLAMQYEITDAAAMEFSTAFYEALADGLAVDGAVGEARKAISLGVRNSLEWGTPVLFMHTPDGVIFEVQGAPRQPAGPPVAAQTQPPPSGEPVQPVHEPAPATESPPKPALGKATAAPGSLRLTGRQVQALLDALLDAYGTEAALRRMVRIELDENLAAIAVGESLRDIVYELIDWAERTGRMVELVAAAHTHNPGNAAMRAFAATIRGVELAAEPGSSPPAPAATVRSRQEQTPRPAQPATVQPKPAASPLAFDWVTIPAGEFLMGSDKQTDKYADENEMPRHKVMLPAFCIARTPVTVAQFAAFVQATGYKTTAEEQASADSWRPDRWNIVRGGDWAHPGGPLSNIKQKMDHPVTFVSWHDALAFCQWAGVCLPSEAEWEKAARGDDGRLWPWGNQIPSVKYANFDMQVRDTTPVGGYPAGASPYGVLDMAGNVWEWTCSLWGWDEHKAEYRYPYDPDDGREHTFAPDTVRRVLRGGSFDNKDVGELRCTYRVRNFPRESGNVMSFRVVRHETAKEN